MKLQAMLSAQHRKNPALGLSNVWRDGTGLIPLDHECFDDLHEFLSRIPVEVLTVPR